MEYKVAPEQPYGVEIKMADGLFVKQMAVPKAGTVVPTHSHRYDHLSMLAVGSVHVTRDGDDLGTFNAPTGIFISAGCKHTFRTLEDNTVVYCVHNIKNAEAVETLEEHQIT